MNPPAGVSPHLPGEYLHPERDVGVISRKHLVALSIVLALLALHLQLNRNWPEYYRGKPRVSNVDSDEATWRCAENITWTTFPDRLEGLPLPYIARTSFNIPISASSIAFIAFDRTASYGSFRVSQTDEPGSEAVVEIEARYWSQEMVENVRVCRLHRGKCDMNGENPWRYGITSDKELGEKAETNIHLRLPASLEPDSPLVIGDLWTILPHYSHHFEGLPESVRFRRLYLTTIESDINVDPAILGDDIDAHSSAGSIRGTFNVSKSLYITTGGAIELRANLLGGRAPDNRYPHFDHYEPSEHTASTRLSMTTGRGPINVQVGLYDAAPHNDAAAQTDCAIARFEVKANTADAPVNLTFVDAPSDSDYALSVDAQVHVDPPGLPWWWPSSPDSSAPIMVKLHETYEGTLKLETSKRVRPSVEWDKNADGSPSGEDPSGRGRERHIQVKSGRGMAEGEVWWGLRKNLSEWTGGPRGMPHVSLKASTSSIRLVL